MGGVGDEGSDGVALLGEAALRNGADLSSARAANEQREGCEVASEMMRGRRWQIGM